MNKINRVLMMIIAMVAIMIFAVGIDKGVRAFQAKKWEEERVAVYEQARADIEEMQAAIQVLSKDPEALLSYIEENELNYVEPFEEEDFGMTGGMPEEEMQNEGAGGSVSGNDVSGNGSFDGSVPGNTVSGNGSFGGSVSGNTVSGNGSLGDSVSGNTVSGNVSFGGSVSGNDVSGNGSFDGSISGNSVSGNTAQNKRICASYEETIKINAKDRRIIAASQIDFSDMKITCLGDSITAATNLDNIENYQRLSYPYQLKEALHAKEVVNLGIGGSSIGRYWDNAFVDRYREIPKDTDLIIVMGGTNDGFCATEEELGSMEERAARTFVGDLDELLRGLKENYPNAHIVLATPLPNVLHDMLRKDRSYLLPQKAFANVIQQLSAEYEIPVIDLYRANLLDTHDAAVIHNFMPDGVHGNQAGYRILAEHMAAEIIGIYETESKEVSEQKQR